MELYSFLKKQHLAMFSEKRAEQQKLLRKMYRQYLASSSLSNQTKGELFSGFYQTFAEEFPAEIYDRELIVGTLWHWGWGRELDLPAVPSNPGHFIPDLAGFLQLGVLGCRERTKRLSDPSMDASLAAFSAYIRHYAVRAEQLAAEASDTERDRLTAIAEDCAWIAEKPPETFRQALQLVWFIQIFLETEANSAAISFGRLDRTLVRYYSDDLQNGRITEREALELLMCFYIKASEGDESQMLTVSGDDENLLSTLCIRAQTLADMRQPSIGVMVTERTGKELMEEAARLALNGDGMPAFFNADVIRQGLRNIGISSEDSEDCGIVGCYEAAPQGVFANTVAAQVNLYDSFDEFLKNDREYPSFDAFWNSFQDAYKQYYRKKLLPRFRASLNDMANLESPFAACLLKNCTQANLHPSLLGCKNYLFGINNLGIGVLIDSIYIIKKLVFEEKSLTLRELCAAAARNFEGDDVLRKIRAVRSAFGSNRPESNALALKVSALIYETTAENPIMDNVIASPALFWFTRDIWDRGYPATLNGRRRDELFSYGVLPSAAPHYFDLLSVLQSAAHIDMTKFPDGCPAMITINRVEAEREGITEALVRSYFAQGGFHLAINTMDSQRLKAAQSDPQSYPDVMVKISGYSAQFIGLDKEIQNAVIERASR